MHYTSSDMNTNCGVTNYQDKHNVQYCDLVSLPDLCTSCQKVTSHRFHTSTYPCQIDPIMTQVWPQWMRS